jgi:quercetin dioxygenase-like cupin family protein
LSQLPGFAECPIVGIASAAEAMPAARMGWAHGFQVRALTVAPGAVTPEHTRAEEEVLLMHEGTLNLLWPGGTLSICPGDTVTVPIGLPRRYSNSGSAPALLYVVRGTDRPQAARWTDPSREQLS